MKLMHEMVEINISEMSIVNGVSFQSQLNEIILNNSISTAQEDLQHRVSCIDGQ